MKDKYDKMPRDLKTKFRQQWGKERYADYEEGRKHINSETHKNRQIGTYLNFDQLLNEEGGRQSQAAIHGAMRYALACLKMGKKWVKHNDMSKRVTFLYCKQEFIDEFKESWVEYQKESTKDPFAAQAAPTAAAPSSSKSVSCKAQIGEDAVGGDTQAQARAQGSARG